MNIHILQKNTEKLLVLLLVSVLIGVSGLYAYFVNETVSNVVERQAIEEEARSLNSKISELEYQYIQKQNQITLDYAYELGFRDVSDPTYIVKGNAPALTFRDAR